MFNSVPGTPLGLIVIVGMLTGLAI